MDKFEFSENAAFYRVREGKDIATIINNYINTKTEEVGDACYVSHTREDTVIDGMKYSFVAYKREKRPNCFRNGVEIEERWKEKIFAYLLVLEYKSYVAIIKKDIDNIRPIRSALKPIDYNVLCKVLNDKKTIYKRVGMNNLDISDYSMRSKALEAENLEAVVSTIGASNYTLGNFRINNKQGTYSIGLNDSKINRLQVKVNFSELILWCKNIVDRMEVTNGKEVSNFLSIFATPVNYKKEYDGGKLNAKYILISLYKLYEEKWIDCYIDQDTGEKKKIEDICEPFKSSFQLQDDGDNNYSVEINDHVKIKVIVREHGITFMCDWMKKILLKSKTTAEQSDITLWEYVIENGAYTIMFNSSKLKYTNRKLFRDNRLIGNLDMFLNLFEEDKKLSKRLGEKDYESNRLTAESTEFPRSSLFKYVEMKYKKNKTIMVCDDLGTEWADYIRIGEDSVALFAAKHKELGFSASAFQEVVGQAQKNLWAFFPLESQWDSKKKKWGKQYKLHQVETQINKVRTPGKTAKDAINLWKKAEKKANYQRDLYIVIDFLSKDVLKNNLLKLKQSKPFEQKKEAIPMLWLISSLWSSCQELNIRLHITCQE